MFSDASADTGDGNLCGCWPLSSSSRAPSEEDIPAQVRILGLLRQMQIWYRVFFYWSAPKSSKCQNFLRVIFGRPVKKHSVYGISSFIKLLFHSLMSAKTLLMIAFILDFEAMSGN